MNRDDIIRMARESGIELYGLGRDKEKFFFILECFAKFVAQHLSYDSIHTCHAECPRPACVAMRKAVKAERQACAKVCDEYAQARYAAEAIRARGEK